FPRDVDSNVTRSSRPNQTVEFARLPIVSLSTARPHLALYRKIQTPLMLQANLPLTSTARRVAEQEIANTAQPAPAQPVLSLRTTSRRTTSWRTESSEPAAETFISAKKRPLLKRSMRHRLK